MYQAIYLKKTQKDDKSVWVTVRFTDDDEQPPVRPTRDKEYLATDKVASQVAKDIQVFEDAWQQAQKVPDAGPVTLPDQVDNTDLLQWNKDVAVFTGLSRLTGDLSKYLDPATVVTVAVVTEYAAKVNDGFKKGHELNGRY